MEPAQLLKCGLTLIVRASSFVILVNLLAVVRPLHLKQDGVFTDCVGSARCFAMRCCSNTHIPVHVFPVGCTYRSTSCRKL